ncbi:RHO1 GDP-GTP exchange protein 2 [Gurleya vavrai]
MVNERKRLEAMSELFESEKAYVKDVEIWSTTFRRFILNCQALSPQKRYLLNSLVFLNSENILELHTKIMNELAIRNEEIRKKNIINYEEGDIYQKLDLTGVETGGNTIYKDLLYIDIYEKHLHQLEIYQYYIQKLPKIEFFLDRETATNKQFAKEMMQFLNETGYIVIGYKHFIYRPTQKLARYPLLLQAISKNTTDDLIKQKLAKVYDFITEKTRIYDKELGNVQNYFKIYKIFTNLYYKDYVERKIGTSLFIKDRRLLQVSNNVYVRSRYRFEPRTFRLLLFDHMLLIIDPVSLIFGESFYIADDPISLYKYKIDENDTERTIKEMQSNFKGKIVLREVDSSLSITFLFKTASQSNELKKSILEQRILLESFFDDNIKLKNYGKIANGVCEEVCITDIYYKGCSYSETEENKILKYKRNIGLLDSNSSAEDNFLDEKLRDLRIDGNSAVDLHTENEDDELNYLRCINQNTRDVFNEITSNSDSNCSEDHLIFVIIGHCIYMKQKESCKIIFHKSVRNITYISEFKILCFIEKNYCYWSHVNKKSEYLMPIFLCNKADMFWYGKTQERAYIVVKLESNSPASYLHLYELTKVDDHIKTSLNTTLYIGAKINSLTFFNSKIIIACPDYEVVEMSTLNTHNLINVTDQTIEWFMKNLDPTVAREIFKIKKGLYLVCNDKVGFLVNEYGSSCEEEIYLAWYTEPTEFRLFDKYLIVVSKINLVVYDIYSMKIISYIIKSNLKFVRCCSAPWLHDEKYLYELKLPFHI